MACATSKASDQPAHTRSLIRTFASRLNILWVLSYWLNTVWIIFIFIPYGTMLNTYDNVTLTAIQYLIKKKNMHFNINYIKQVLKQRIKELRNQIWSNLEFLSLKGGCKGSSESTLVKMPHFWNHMSRLISFSRWLHFSEEWFNSCTDSICTSNNDGPTTNYTTPTHHH